MTSTAGTTGRVVVSVAAWSSCCSSPYPLPAQTSPYERTFPQSKATIEKALIGLQSSLAGHLPVLDGFAKPGDHPLDRYQRGYYQSTVQISSTAVWRIAGADHAPKLRHGTPIRWPLAPDTSC